MKKILSLIFLLPLLVSAFTVSDVSNAVFLSEKEIIMKQTSETGYRLDDKITRAEVIGIALKTNQTLLPDDYKCKKYFSDTIMNDWVCRAIELAADQGVISRENSKSRSQDPITRAEAFAILYKISSLNPSQEKFSLVSKDVDAVEWQKDLFIKIRNSEIQVPGTKYISSDNYQFFPNRSATRAEIFDFGAQIIKKKGVVDVIDGDTIHYGDLKIRMIGLDAPESSRSRYGYIECFGPEATEHLKQLLKDAKELTIEKDPSQGETDKYGRTLAYVFLNGKNINTQMILDGFAFEYTYSKAYKYQKEHKNAETVAKNAKLGLWSSTTCSGDRKEIVMPSEEKVITEDQSPIIRNYIIGPRGGCYYLSENNTKVYVDKTFCQ